MIEFRLWTLLSQHQVSDPLSTDFTLPNYSIICIDEILRCQYLIAARNQRHCLEEAKRPASYLRLYN